MPSSFQVFALVQFSQSQIVQVFCRHVMFGAEVARGDRQGTLRDGPGPDSVPEIGERSRQIAKRQRDRWMVWAQRALGQRDRTFGRVLRSEQIALEPELLGDQVQGRRVCRMVHVGRFLYPRGSAQKRTRLVVRGCALQYQPKILQRPCDGRVGFREPLPLHGQTAIQDLSSLVVPARRRQGTTKMVECPRHVEAIGACRSLAQGHGTLGDGDCSVELRSRDQRIAEIEERRDHVRVPGSEPRFSGAKRALGQRQGFDVCSPTIDDQRSNQSV